MNNISEINLSTEIRINSTFKILKKILGTYFSLKTPGGSSLDFEAKTQYLMILR